MQTHACSDHNTNHSVCGVQSVLWAGLTVVQQGQREGRQTIGHNTNISNRYTALYIYSDAQSLLLLYIYRELYREMRYTVCIHYVYNNVQLQY